MDPAIPPGCDVTDIQRNEEKAFWFLVFSLFLLTRLPITAQYFTIDNVNLAFSLERFDPRAHQPQPPGYPLFVVFNRLTNVIFRNPATTFKATGLLVSALCLPLTFAVGKQLFNEWTGRAAVFMLLLAPPFWYASVEGPLRPHLALFSLLTAYCCWRCWNGEKSFVMWGALSLGIGSGFRPDLGGFLFPLWLLSAWMGTRSLATVVKGLLAMAGIVFLWLGGMAYTVDGFKNLYELNRNYVFNQSQRQSIVLGAADHAWLRQISRLVVWNGTAIVASLWAVPIFLRAKERVGLLSSQFVFMLVWLLPGFLFQALIHIEDPGHTLFSVPAICISAAYLIFVATQRIVKVREISLAFALIINVMLFLNFFSLPAAAETTGGRHSLRNTFLFGVFETSIGELRFQDNTAALTLAELQQLTPGDRRLVIVSSDAGVRDWFMNWRIARYYVSDIDIWVIADLQNPKSIEHVRRDRTLEKKVGNSLEIPIPAGARIIWLLEREGPFHSELKKVVSPLPGGAYLSYTDIRPEMLPFRVMEFNFVADSN
jgi:hypothetical protein